jgi:heme/copper-type cytochrome/quinol oxidase subunit 1
VCWQSDVLVDGWSWWRAHLFLEFPFFCLVDGWSWRARFLLVFFNSVSALSGGSFISFVGVVSFLFSFVLSWFSSRKEREITRGRLASKNRCHFPFAQEPTAVRKHQNKEATTNPTNRERERQQQQQQPTILDQQQQHQIQNHQKKIV